MTNTIMCSNTKLKTIETEIIRLKNNIALDMLSIGDYLIQAKGMLSHGDFAQWLQDNVSISDRTARNYMLAAKKFPKEKRQAIADFEPTKIYYLAEIAEEDREEFLKNHNITAMTTRELKETIEQEKLCKELCKPLYDKEKLNQLHEQNMQTNDFDFAAKYYLAVKELHNTYKTFLDALDNRINELERQTISN